MKRSPITRTAGLKRSGGISPVSQKRTAENRERKKTRVEVLERCGNLCEARLSICTRTVDDLHEIKTRARGGSITDPDNCLGLCRSCHTFITDNPQFALDNGFIVPSWAQELDFMAARAKRSEYRQKRGSQTETT